MRFLRHVALVFKITIGVRERRMFFTKGSVRSNLSLCYLSLVNTSIYST